MALDDAAQEQLRTLLHKRNDKIAAVSFLLRELLKDHPPEMDWALTDPDGKTYAYVTLAGEWQRRHLTSERIKELRQRS